MTVEEFIHGGTGWSSWSNRAVSNQLGHRKHAAIVVTQDELQDRLVKDAKVEEFMTEHFRERTVIQKKESEILSNYACRFYSPDCDWRRWGPYSDESGNETVLGIELVDSGVRVITNGFHFMRLRYHLRPAGPNWLIGQVDFECLLCAQRGRDPNCMFCGARSGTKSLARKMVEDSNLVCEIIPGLCLPALRLCGLASLR